MHHPWWPHLFSWPRFLDPISWLWLSVKGYAFSSSGEQIEISVSTATIYKHYQCSAPWCLRIGRHFTADGHHRLCRKHHPDLPDRKLSHSEIVAHHQRAKNRRRR